VLVVELYLFHCEIQSYTAYSSVGVASHQESPAELKIAEALDNNHILFFPNSRGRVSDRYQQRKPIEVDFLIIYQGKVGILEVDGATYHPSAAKDHQRDRLFMRQGVLCSRFDAGECMNNPQGVVEEFLELLVSSY
jgi:very-short-patch-repair endonuclease